MTLSVSPGITRTFTAGLWTEGAPTIGATPLTDVMLVQAHAGSITANANTARAELRIEARGDVGLGARNENMGGLEQRGVPDAFYGSRSNSCQIVKKRLPRPYQVRWRSASSTRPSVKSRCNGVIEMLPL
jgi:hypothetical protein